MSRIITLVLFLYQSSLWAQLSITPLKSGPHKSGEVVEAQLELKDKNLLTKLSPSLIQKSTIPQALWFMHVDPWQLSGTRMITQATVVLGPEFNTEKEVVLSVSEISVGVTFEGWNIAKSGQQQPQPLLYEELPWYQRAWWEKNKLLILIIIATVTSLAFHFIRKILRTRAQKKFALKKRQEMIDSFLHANSFEHISEIWLRREIAFDLFPEKEASLRKFFDVLNKYQFKPTATQEELSIALNAKNQLVEELRQVANGA